MTGQEEFIDLVFAASSPEIQKDHAQLLYTALVSEFPELADLTTIGIHQMKGADTGTGMLCLGQRAKLLLRVGKSQTPALTNALEGKTINLGEHAVHIGRSYTRPLTPFATLHAKRVVNGHAEEGEFFARAGTELEQMGIKCGMICGKRDQFMLPAGSVVGYNLMLHDLSPDHSMRLQSEGLGLYRQYGCGIFIPHKSIKAVFEPLG
jgi:CRISPR-associated protein Cas6